MVYVMGGETEAVRNKTLCIQASSAPYSFWNITVQVFAGMVTTAEFFLMEYRFQVKYRWEEGGATKVTNPGSFQNLD